MTDNIKFSSDPGADLATFLKEKNYSKIAVLTDENTERYCYPQVRNALNAHHNILIRSGEEQKSIATCESIWSEMTEQGLDRHAVLIVVGGGVLGDMGGFCAATYKRGIDFILIPTTLLSQVDASIGGKLGIDFKHFKNHIGVFQTPALTLLHAGFLDTLPESEKRSGFAEVIKHALIADLAMWEEIRKKSLQNQSWDVLLKHSVNIKLKVVTKDPYEKGLRKILNAGHTIGHALETFLLNANRKILHGEAVAAGLVCEGFLAKEKGLLSQEAFEGLLKYIKNLFGKVSFAQEEEAEIVALTRQDKKNRENKILCVLLDGIGKARWDCEIRPEEVKEALSFYRSA
ncbi:MAG: 3-dehydroquinate synthase [Cyclobacteriaceae bacterium]